MMGTSSPTGGGGGQVGVLIHTTYVTYHEYKQKLRRYRSRLMVHPENPLKLFFDMVVMACIVLIAILLPVEIAFDLDTNFVLEILLNPECYI